MSYLTEQETEALTLLAKLMNRFNSIVGTDVSRTGDISEIIIHIHALQNMILAQVAARTYPDKYRLMGEIIHG